MRLIDLGFASLRRIYYSLCSRREEGRAICARGREEADAGAGMDYRRSEIPKRDLECRRRRAARASGRASVRRSSIEEGENDGEEGRRTRRILWSQSVAGWPWRNTRAENFYLAPMIYV